MADVGIWLALLSAFFFGTGDFAGGAAARKATAWQVLLFGSSQSVLVLMILAFFTNEPLPSLEAILFSSLAGVGGALGLVFLYRGLAMGRAALVSPLSGVIGALLPLLLSAVTMGLPAPLKLVGMALAVPAIWLVSQPDNSAQKQTSSSAMLMGVLGGLGFGLFFIFLDRVPVGPVFGPMVATKAVGAVIGAVFVLLRREGLPPVRGNLAILFPGFLDPVANVFFLLATHTTRLDIAAMLSSLYPAITVLCAALFLKESIHAKQWLGLVLSVAAIMLIAA